MPPSGLDPARPYERPRVVVSDAGPLISLGRLDLLPLLGEFFAEVQVPGIVVEECLARPDNVDARRIRQALSNGMLLSCTSASTPLPGLEPGESAAIARALEIGAALLMDERAGRAVAREPGLRVAGTAAPIGMAKKRGPIASARDAFARLHDTDFRISPQVIRTVLARVGE